MLPAGQANVSRSRTPAFAAKRPSASGVTDASGTVVEDPRLAPHLLHLEPEHVDERPGRDPFERERERRRNAAVRQLHLAGGGRARPEGRGVDHRHARRRDVEPDLPILIEAALLEVDVNALTVKTTLPTSVAASTITKTERNRRSRRSVRQDSAPVRHGALRVVVPGQLTAFQTKETVDSAFWYWLSVAGVPSGKVSVNLYVWVAPLAHSPSWTVPTPFSLPCRSPSASPER